LRLNKANYEIYAGGTPNAKQVSDWVRLGGHKAIFKRMTAEASESPLPRRGGGAGVGEAE